MINVKLVKGKPRGWFLTIGDSAVKNTWAVTSLELLTLLKMLKEREQLFLKEEFEIKGNK